MRRFIVQFLDEMMNFEVEELPVFYYYLSMVWSAQVISGQDLQATYSGVI